MLEFVKRMFTIFMHLEDDLPEGDYEFEPCSVCNGQGRIWPDGADDFFHCGHCRGTGQIAVPCTEIPSEEAPPELPAEEPIISNVTPFRKKEDVPTNP